MDANEAVPASAGDSGSSAGRAKAFGMGQRCVRV